ncbi:MAG: autotransporter domain-containing protein, partial [Verrucomicrobiota bacterium]
NSNSYDGTRVVIDVSGDGTGSSTLDSAARDNALAAGVTTINGIAIGSSRTDPNVPTSLEQYYLDNIAGGNGSFVVLSEGFDDFEDAILTKLLAEITGTNPIASGLTPILPAIRNTELLSVAAAYGDINARLMRMRAGIRSQPTTTTSASPVAPASAKGGLSGKGGKGGLAKDALIPEASVTTYTRPWEVYGTIGYTSASYDAQTALTQGASVATAIPGYDVDLLHGTVGVEYDLDENFSVGAAIVASTGDIDLDDGSEVDTDRFGFAIYGSFFRNVSALGVPAAFHADLLYGYSQASYDSDRVTGGGIASGDTDGDSHVIQLHTGLSFENNNFTHGPIAGLFYQTGTIDGYSETGPGALSYSDVDVDSLRSQLGYQASYEISTQVGKVVPQVRAAWEHEFEDDEIIVSGLSLGEPASDIAVLGAAVYWQFHSSAYAVLDYEARLADNFDSHTIWLRIGAEF